MKKLEKMLFEGLKKNDLKKVVWALNLGLDINTLLNGRTPLHLAVWGDNIALVKLLIDSGADVNVKNENGSTPLHFASLEDNIAIAKLLIDSGAKVNAKGWQNYTPLHMAVLRDKIEIAKLLIASGADVGAKNKWGTTPLHDAKFKKSMKDLLQGVTP